MVTAATASGIPGHTEPGPPASTAETGGRPRLEGAFSTRARRLGVGYVCATLPVVLAGGVFADDASSYLLAFVLVASAPYTLPAIPVTRRAIRRASPVDRRSWQLWLLSVGGLYVTGGFMLLGTAFGWETPLWTGILPVALIGACLITSVVRLARARSGGRALSVDVAECLIAVVTVCAPPLLIWGERIVHSEHSWFTVPSALAATAMVGGCYWAVVLYIRLGPTASGTELCGLILTGAGAVNGALQVALGLSDFTLPAVPLLLLQAVSASMIMLVPLFLPRGVRLGLGGLPPHAQVRGGGLSAVAMLVGLPALLGVTYVVHDETSWAVPYTTTVLAILLTLGALRHLATVNETRRLYAQVERAAEERRELLTAVMQRADADRHRVAAQLHEQAVTAYASFVSFIQASGNSLGDGTPLSTASSRVRDDLARHADSLRELLLAIAPLDRAAATAAPPAAPGARDGDGDDLPGLGALVRAYLDSLYGDRPAPHLRVSIAGRLVLDWTTETIALRIVQEALRNVQRHSEATNVDVMIDTVADGVEVHVVDDGVGFDAARTLFESGIAAMREFAALTGGTITVASAPGAGTTVTARLGLGTGPGVEDDDELDGDDHDYEADYDDVEEYDEYDADWDPPVRTLRLVHGGANDA